jgi:hypothetical protein
VRETKRVAIDAHYRSPAARARRLLLERANLEDTRAELRVGRGLHAARKLGRASPAELERGPLTHQPPRFIA